MLVAGAMVIYFATAFGTGGADMGMIRRNVTRKPGETPAAGEAGPGPE